MIAPPGFLERRTVTPRPTPPRDAGKRPATAPADAADRSAAQTTGHFVLKRGHYGRYRFSLRSALGGISGEVFLPTADRPRGEQEREARAQIEQLARSLLAQIAHDQSEP